MSGHYSLGQYYNEIFCDPAYFDRTPPAEVRKLEQEQKGLADRVEELTLREIGEILDLSRERVRQIESRALNKLRRSHKTKSLAGYLN